MRNLAWSGFVFMLLISGCGWNGTPTRSNDITPLTSITIRAEYSTIAAKTTTKLTAIGNVSGLFTRDVTDKVIWSSDTPAVAAFGSSTFLNRVKGVAAGNAILTATIGNLSASCPITVSSATISTVAITPNAPSIAAGLSQQFTATGTFSDATTQDISLDADWASAAPGVATVSNDSTGKEFAQAVTVGTSTIGATFDGVSGTALLTVTAPVLQSISLSPANPTVLTLSTKQFTATATYSGGSTANITSQVAWSSSKTDIATIGSGGMATTLSQGTTTISATLGGLTTSTNLKATGGNLDAITLSPAIATLVKDIRSPITATGSFSNGSIRDVTGAVTWTPADSTLAAVTIAGGNLAWLEPRAVTLVPTTITATSGSRSATANVTVTAPLLSSIAFSATSLDLTAGTSTPLTVLATFSDNSIQDVTAISTVTSNDPAKATIAAAGHGTERVTGVAAGTTTISAVYGGKTAPSATVTVRARNLLSLAISPNISTVSAGNRVPFAVIANYGDGTSVDVTNEPTASWSIDSEDIAILADGVNQPGQIVGVDSGTATLTVTFGGKSQTAKITVTGP